ncbi:MAG: SH3 domain-containing protein [Desulfobulbaceae bacterium]|nr:SH3 domain-containing protein [Desulfobulbaceae bacterium]HIJ78044.1 SH3 domain-containing protein [Deltaproteobacteria bacterium]
MTKKSPLLRLLQLTTIITIALAVTVSAFAAEYVSVKKDGVNIRSGPDTNQEILWEVFKNFPLQVISRQGKWAQVVDFEGDKGWVYSPLLAKKKTLIVKVNSVNMRVGAGKDYEIMASVKYGVVFTPLEKEGEWVKVQHEDGTSGWIYDKLLWPN